MFENVTPVKYSTSTAISNAVHHSIEKKMGNRIMLRISETFPCLPGIAGIIVNLFELNFNTFNALKSLRKPFGIVVMSLPIRLISLILSDKLLKFGT